MELIFLRETDISLFTMNTKQQILNRQMNLFLLLQQNLCLPSTVAKRAMQKQKKQVKPRKSSHHRRITLNTLHRRLGKTKQYSMNFKSQKLYFTEM